MSKPCSFRGCAREARTKGFCSSHYQSVFVRGRNPADLVPREAISEETGFVGLKLGVDLVARVRKAMERAGIKNKSTWWRRAAEEKLERDEG